jgi:hypothetical protein
MTPDEEAVAEWLLTFAAWGKEQAEEEWRTEGVALLQWCKEFDAIRLPRPLVLAAAGRRVPADVDDYLAAALHGAPVFRGANGQWFYVLVEPTLTVDGLDYIRDQVLGVPRPDLVGNRGRWGSYWSVPLTKPGALGKVAAVSQLVAHGRLIMAEQEETP